MFGKIFIQFYNSMNIFFENSLGYHFSGYLCTISIIRNSIDIVQLIILSASAVGILFNTYWNIKNRKRKR